jgi:hypothetical protein
MAGLRTAARCSSAVSVVFPTLATNGRSYDRHVRIHGGSFAQPAKILDHRSYVGDHLVHYARPRDIHVSRRYAVDSAVACIRQRAGSLHPGAQASSPTLSDMPRTSRRAPHLSIPFPVLPIVRCENRMSFEYAVSGLTGRPGDACTARSNGRTLPCRTGSKQRALR